jgi:serine protease Do
MAKDVMEKIIDRGRVVRGWLGVNPEDIDPQMAEFFDIESTDGVVIALVVEKSPADKGGLEQNDIITEFDGEPVKDVVSFRRMVADVEPGSTVEIVVLRDGERKRLDVEIGERKDLSRRESLQEEEGASPLFVGVSLEVLDDYYRRELNIPRDLEGLVVTDVDQTSPAAEAGLSQGDVIVEINRRKVRNINDFNEIMERSRKDKVLLLVYRRGSQSYIIIKS